MDGDTGILLLDVTGTTQDGLELIRVGVPFATLDLSAHDLSETDGLIGLRKIPAILTPEGAEVFGTYTAGEPLDPVTLSLPVADCASGATAGVSTAVVDPVADGTPAWAVWAIVAVLLATIVAAQGIVAPPATGRVASVSSR